VATKIIQFVFFANYFIGLLAVALCVETVFQLNLPLNSIYFYLFLFCITVLYYTRAYIAPSIVAANANPRTIWYNQHKQFIKVSQVILTISCIVLGSIEFLPAYKGIFHLPFFYIIMLLSVPLAAILYYGLLPRSVFRLNLRNTGWLKPFVIGYVWAGCVSLFPVVVQIVEHNVRIEKPGFMLWLFVKNWMFCTVNAIMFDMKDYADDANKELKTFVVRFGLTKTIYYILLPLLFIGFISFIIFALYNHFGAIPVIINLVPFVCLMFVAFTLHHQKPILYYLIVIDGLLLVKAVCGIVSMLFLKYF